MIKVGLIGLGFMGRTHLDNYVKLENDGFPIKVSALCDIDERKFMDVSVNGNLDSGTSKYDFSRYNLYSSIDEMLQKENLDYVDIALPTYLHAETSIKSMNNKVNVLCEKPMALNSSECLQMIKVAEDNKMKLMIAQCLRFWPEYEHLKKCVEDGRYGKVTAAYFFRGGATGNWSYDNWLLKEEKSGGCILDLHIHDVDVINWLFGMPQSVSTLAKKVIPGCGYDVLSTNYHYEDKKVVNAQSDWTLYGDYGFQMVFRVNFERGNLIYENWELKVNPANQKGFKPELSNESAYYREIKYFASTLINNSENYRSDPQSTLDTMRIVEAEKESADKDGIPVRL